MDSIKNKLLRIKDHIRLTIFDNIKKIYNSKSLLNNQHNQDRKIHIVYFSCEQHFKYIFLSLKSIEMLSLPFIGKIYLYFDKRFPLNKSQKKALKNICLDISIRKTKLPMSWGGAKLIINELIAFKEISIETYANDYIAKIDSDVIVISDKIFRKVLDSSCHIIGQSYTNQLDFTYTQGGCYFLSVSTVPVIFEEKIQNIAIKTAKQTNNPLFNCPEDSFIYNLVKFKNLSIGFETYFHPMNDTILPNNLNQEFSIIHFENRKKKMIKFGELFFQSKALESVSKIDTVKTAYSCMIWGGYGWGNVGDELTLDIAFKELSKSFDTSSIFILSPAPEYSKWLYPERQIIPFVPIDKDLTTTEILNLKNTPLWVDILYKCKLLFLVGGGYLTDLFNIKAKLQPIALAQKFNIPIRTAPIGIGPFKAKNNEHITAYFLQNSDLWVRDEDSLEFAYQNGIFAKLQCDDGFKIKDFYPEIFNVLNKKKKNNEIFKIGVCIFNQHGADNFASIENWWVDFFKFMQNKSLGLFFEGFCFHTSLNLDFYTMIKIFQKAELPLKNILPPFIDFREALKNLINYDMIISSRFHAIVTASTIGMQSLAIASGEYYISKMKSSSNVNPQITRLIIPEFTSYDEMAEIVMDWKINSAK
ncbi:MAG: polysaccharide pyruvyl transferase family protein [Desulfobacterales bacterium]|nr:polysaccharide pyruvyl transferase family protein [Desulfobacterales bacterium]